MFGDRLKEFRISHDLKQAELAKMLGVSVSVISMHETGHVRTYASYVSKVNKAFGTDLPIVSVCKNCKEEFYSEEKLCPKCVRALKTKKAKAVRGKLKTVAKAAEAASVSYGKYVAGETVRDVKKEKRTPEFLELGKTIVI